MSGCEQHYKHHRMALFTASFCFALGYSAPGFTKPDMQPLGPNIVDKGSEYYYFRVNDFDSADGARHYRVWTAVPRKAEPASGYPVLYMLDGNAVMDRLPETLLKQLSGYSPPVIVAVGYQTSLPFDLNGRAYDYTPVLGTVSAGNANNPRFQRKTGGGPEFRQLLETRIAPQVEQGLRINPERRGIWGHSYGGLFVLGSWLSSSFFHQYYSASPSLSRDNFALLNRLTAINPAQYCHKNLIIMFEYGLELYQSNNPEKAIVTWQFITDKYIESGNLYLQVKLANALFNIGFIYYELNQPETAIFYWKKLVERYETSSHPEIISLVGKAWTNLGQVTMNLNSKSPGFRL